MGSILKTIRLLFTIAGVKKFLKQKTLRPVGTEQLGVSNSPLVPSSGIPVSGGIIKTSQ
jgi:hypothetical protein